MRVAKIPISLHLLEALLPKGSRIISFNQDEIHHYVNVYVEHESFDEVREGEFPPTKTMVATRHQPIEVHYAS